MSCGKARDNVQICLRSATNGELSDSDEMTQQTGWCQRPRDVSLGLWRFLYFLSVFSSFGGCLPAVTFCSYHLNISEKKNLPKAGSVSVLDMKFRNSSALLRKASLMLASNFWRRRNSMLFV